MFTDPARETAVVRSAFAKINLDLRVGPVDADGYHPLSTVFQALALHDTLTFEPGGGEPFAITCDDPGVPTDDRNLVWKAAAALWSASGRHGGPRGVRVDIRKGIPAQGGLGGGSADAAVSLVALDLLWGTGLDRTRAEAIAARLGADVAFFLVGGTAWATGRGDRVEAWPDLPGLEVVLAVPAFGVATADAYRWFDEWHAGSRQSQRPGFQRVRREPRLRTSDGKLRPGFLPKSRAESRPFRGAGSQSLGDVSEMRAWLAGCRNDLEPPVIARHPVIGEIRGVLRAGGAVHALMSGSGSTVFGLFEGPEPADAAVAVLRDAGVATRRTRTLGREEHLCRSFGPGPVAALPLA